MKSLLLAFTVVSGADDVKCEGTMIGESRGGGGHCRYAQ